MKRFTVLMSLLLVLGCVSGPAKFTIPDEPDPTQFKAYQVKGGVCIDDAGLGVLQSNIEDLKAYADKMREILEGLQKGK